MPRLAFDRKDTGWRIDWHGNAQRPSISPENAFSVAVSWPPSLEPLFRLHRTAALRLDLTLS
jgi:hypothetical protein